MIFALSLGSISSMGTPVKAATSPAICDLRVMRDAAASGDENSRKAEQPNPKEDPGVYVQRAASQYWIAVSAARECADYGPNPPTTRWRLRAFAVVTNETLRSLMMRVPIGWQYQFANGVRVTTRWLLQDIANDPSAPKVVRSKAKQDYMSECMSSYPAYLSVSAKRTCSAILAGGRTHWPIKDDPTPAPSAQASSSAPPRESPKVVEPPVPSCAQPDRPYTWVDGPDIHVPEAFVGRHISLALDFDDSGRIANSKISSTSGDSLLDAVVLADAQYYKILPPTKKCKSVATTINFSPNLNSWGIKVSEVRHWTTDSGGKSYFNVLSHMVGNSSYCNASPDMASILARTSSGETSYLIGTNSYPQYQKFNALTNRLENYQSVAVEDRFYADIFRFGKSADKVITFELPDGVPESSVLLNWLQVRCN